MILFKRVGSAFNGIEGREWALLSLETLGVVAGILIAFELNEWAARRSEARREHALLERLFDESRATVSTLRRFRDLMDERISAERGFAVLLVHDNQCPPEPMWSAVATLTQYPTIAVPSSVYQEIMGSGGLSAIEDPTVRDAVSGFRSDLEYVQGQNANFREYAGRNNPVSNSDPRVRYDFDPSRDEPQTAHYDRAAYCSDHAFRNGVADMVRNHMVIAESRTRILGKAIRMCVTIGSSLGKSCQPTGGGPLQGDDASLAKEIQGELRKTSEP